jgi:hypothetical protein
MARFKRVVESEWQRRDQHCQDWPMLAQYVVESLEEVLVRFKQGLRERQSNYAECHAGQPVDQDASKEAALHVRINK